MCSSQEHFGNPIKAITRAFHPERYRNGLNILPKDLYNPPNPHQAKDESNGQRGKKSRDYFNSEKHRSFYIPIV